MAVTYIFAAQFTKSKVKTTPANAPTIDIFDGAAPTAALLVTGGTPTQATNCVGYYVYSYTTSTLTERPVANFHTTDTTVDLQDLPSFPVITLDANGYVNADVMAVGGQVATASDPVAFPAAIGTSTYAGGAVASVSGSIGSLATQAKADVATATQTGLTAQGYTTALATALGGVADSVLDEVVEGSLTMRQILRIALAFVAGVSNGGGTSTITFKDSTGTKTRISARANSVGDRTEMTLDPS